MFVCFFIVIHLLLSYYSLWKVIMIWQNLPIKWKKITSNTLFWEWDVWTIIFPNTNIHPKIILYQIFPTFGVAYSLEWEIDLFQRILAVTHTTVKTFWVFCACVVSGQWHSRLWLVCRTEAGSGGVNNVGNGANYALSNWRRKKYHENEMKLHGAHFQTQERLQVPKS